MMSGSANYGGYQNGFSADHNSMDGFLTGLQEDFKQQDAFAFPHPVGAPLSSNDSTVPSTISEQSMNMFPSLSAMQKRANFSAASSEWGDSRSSSISVTQHESPFGQIPAPQQPPALTTSQWQPGQSVPVDVNALSEEFQRAAAQARQSAQRHHPYEQPLAWPADEAYARRDSQTSLLAHSLGNIGIHNPQPQQTGSFKSPPPAAGIAARRQRPRPAALGLASLRSQSYSGAVPPVSPGQIPQQQSLTAGQPLRRIRSSNVMNGVAQGRVMKSMPGSAQRSPLSWTFTDAMNSPKAARHVSSQSQGNLAPPTPMSPSEYHRQLEQPRQFPQWQTSSAHVSRQPSINEADFDYGNLYHPSASVPPQNFSSPPHTPSYHQQRVGNNVITENTPPQSAPASQSCFAPNLWAPTHPQLQQAQQSQSQVPNQQMQAMPLSQPQHYVNDPVPEQQFQMANVTFVPPQQVKMPSSGPPPGLPLAFAQGVPIVNADGTMQMAFPPQMQLLQQQQQQQAQAQIQPQQVHTPPQMPYTFMTAGGGSPSLQVTAQLPKQSTQPGQDLFVHEYNPPQDVRRSAIPRKPVDTGPKNYTFSNTGPENFDGERKGKKTDTKMSAASSSPASSTGASCS